MQHSSDSNNQHHLVRGPQSTRGRGRVRGRGNRGHPQQGRGRGKGRGRGRGRGQGRGGSTRGRNGSGGGASSVAGDDLQWSETTNTINVERFTENVGPAVPISAHIVDIFRLFFTTSLIDLIVEQTNLYASQLMETAQYEKWTKVTADEIWAYFGYVILMGINRLPALADYWKLDPTYRYRPIADKITRDRFMEITRYFHFVDNSTLPLRTDPGYDKLGKIRPVIDHISRQFLSVYSPHCKASIDEAMVAFKGRSTMKQYLPKKPVKRGFKVWVRADAVSGYVGEFDIYTGKVVGEGEFGLGGNVVKRLTCNITGRNHQLTGSYNSRKYGG